MRSELFLELLLLLLHFSSVSIVSKLKLMLQILDPFLVGLRLAGISFHHFRETTLLFRFVQLLEFNKFLTVFQVYRIQAVIGLGQLQGLVGQLFLLGREPLFHFVNLFLQVHLGRLDAFRRLLRFLQLLLQDFFFFRRLLRSVFSLLGRLLFEIF